MPLVWHASDASVLRTLFSTLPLISPEIATVCHTCVLQPPYTVYHVLHIL